jgi:hypothetical protein
MRCFRHLALLLLAVAFISLPGLGAQADRRPVSYEDLWLMKRVGVPVPSPDRRCVVFFPTEPACDSQDQVAGLWIVPADGNAPPGRISSAKGERGRDVASAKGQRFESIGIPSRSRCQRTRICSNPFADDSGIGSAQEKS